MNKYLDYLHLFPDNYAWSISVLEHGVLGIVCVGDSIQGKGIPITSWTMGPTQDPDASEEERLTRIIDRCVRQQEEMEERYG